MKESTLRPLLAPILAEFALELEAVDVVPAGKRRLVRIVVDGDGPNGDGPLLDDIAEATKAVSAALDTSTVTGDSPYTLEVSSRGVGRPLTEAKHWRRNVGRLVEVTTTGGQRALGRIAATEEDAAVVDVEGVDHRIPFSDVSKALIQVELNRQAAEPGEEG